MVETINTNSEVEFILNAIAREYLRNAAPIDATEENESTISRDKHGVIHSCFVAACVIAFYNLHKKYNKDADQIDNKILKMLQITAMFHDAGRASDNGCDCREWEEESRTLAEEYLIALGFEENSSKLVASAIVYAEYPKEIENLNLDSENKNLLKILSEILHDADSANYLRFGDFTFFDINKLNIYQRINETYQRMGTDHKEKLTELQRELYSWPGNVELSQEIECHEKTISDIPVLQRKAHQSLSKILKAIKQFQVYMGDSKEDEIILGHYDPETKKKYEWDPYSQIAAVFCQQKALAELYDNFVELPIMNGEPDGDGILVTKCLESSESECLFGNTEQHNPYDIKAHEKTCIVFRGDGRGLKEIKDVGGMHPYCVHDDTRTGNNDLLVPKPISERNKSNGVVYASNDADVASHFGAHAAGNNCLYMLKAPTVITEEDSDNIYDPKGFTEVVVPGGFDYEAILAVKEGDKIFISKHFLAYYGARVYRLIHYLLEEKTTICKDDLLRLSGGLKIDATVDDFDSQMQKKEKELSALITIFGRKVVSSYYQTQILIKFLRSPQEVLDYWNKIFSRLNDKTQSALLVVRFYEKYKSFCLYVDSPAKQRILQNRLIYFPNCPELWQAGLQKKCQVQGDPVDDNFEKWADMNMFNVLTYFRRGFDYEHDLYEYMNTKGYLEELNRLFGKEVIENNIQALPYLFMMLNDNQPDPFGFKQENLFDFWKEISTELVQSHCEMVSIPDYNDSEKITGTLGELMLLVGTIIYNCSFSSFSSKKLRLLQKRILDFAIPLCQGKIEEGSFYYINLFLTAGFDCEHNADFTNNADRAFVDYFNRKFSDLTDDNNLILRECMNSYVNSCSDTSSATQSPTPFQFFPDPSHSDTSPGDPGNETEERECSTDRQLKVPA